MPADRRVDAARRGRACRRRRHRRRAPRPCRAGAGTRTADGPPRRGRPPACARCGSRTAGRTRAGSDSSRRIAREIGQVGVQLAREHGIVGEPALLRPLDLAVPVGALDEPHRNALAARLGQPPQPAQHRHRAPAIGLHREPEPGPAGERGIAGTASAEHAERQVEPVLLLRIDGEARAAALAPTRASSTQARQQLARQPLASLPGSKRGCSADSLTEMLGRSISAIGVLRHAAAPPPCRSPPAPACSARSSGRRRPRCAPPRPACRRRSDSPWPPAAARATAPPRCAAEHELVAHHAHRLAQRLADHRLARLRDQPLQDAGRACRLALAELDDAARSASGPRSRR